MSKIADANDKVAKGVVKGYKKAEGAVVGGYKKIEDGFVNTFLAKGDETTEEAKERMKQEQAARHEEYEKRMQEQQEKIRERIENSKPKI